MRTSRSSVRARNGGCSASAPRQHGRRRFLRAGRAAPRHPLDADRAWRRAGRKGADGALRAQRTPVREALIKLKEEGLVEIFPQAGTFVARIPVAAFPKPCSFRQALECATVQMLAERAGPAIIDRLDQVVRPPARGVRGAGPGSLPRRRRGFYEELASLAGLPGVWRLAQAARARSIAAGA